jgi:soluble lytic murein transglycosylase
VTTSRAARAGHRTIRRRRALGLLGVAVLIGIAALTILPKLSDTVREITLPLRHEDVIRQQAAAKNLDPSLIAGVIYVESRFRDQTSPAGAKGLMQITPATARYIAQKSGGSQFELGDLATPQINIAYGSFYLRYLLDRYGNNETLALAAYNGGEGNVDRWIVRAGRAGKAFRVRDIPFKETRDYVSRVEQAQRDYRAHYSDELGL